MTDNDSYTGMTVPSYNQILDNATAKTKEIFGEDANADSSNSTLGMMNKLFSFFCNGLYQKNQDVYFSRFIDLMEGPDLDRWGANTGTTRLPATNAQVTLTFIGNSGTVINEGAIFATDGDVEFELINPVTIGSDGTGNGIAQSSDKTGDANVAANTITNILELADGLDTVNNPNQAYGGAEAETDEAYKVRLHLAENAQPGPTNSGLYAALYAVDGVKLVKIVEESANQQDIPDRLHFYVQGGNPQDIANAIATNMAWGIVTVGSQSQTVTDAGGNQHTINFDIATVVPIYVLIQYTTTSDFDSENGINDLKTSINNYINSLDMGELIDYNRFYQVAYNIDGIKTASIKIGTDPNNLAQSNIQLSEYDSANLANVKAVDSNG